jgi:transcriptional regulator GlxA family with amidase domain
MRSTAIPVKATTVVMTAFAFSFAVGAFMFSQPMTGAHADTQPCVVQPTQSTDSDSGLNVVTASISETCPAITVDMVGVAADGSTTTLTTSPASVATPASFRFGSVGANYTAYQFVIENTGQVIHTFPASK